MIKNIIFDIGNVILNFNITEVLQKFTSNRDNQKFILDNIINSPEWLGNSLIDTGYVTRENAIEIVKDRTNHINDTLITDFWYNYNNYAKVDERVLKLIKKLKDNNYKVYLLSNINPYTHEFVEKSGLFELVDGYVLSYQEHKVKPFIGIYKTLLERYNLIPNESLFIDDNEKNVITGNSLGIISKKVEPDNYNSIINIINECCSISFES
jgi:putative hydrolase of the HAD superfamily